MHWRAGLYHDETPFYLWPREAKQGDVVTLRVRVPSEAPANLRVMLYLLKHGEGERQTTQLHSSGDWGRVFEAKLELYAPTVRYVFLFESDEASYWLSTRGARAYQPAFRDWFQFVAGVHAPNWLPGRVFYQIFPDRFRNGDPTNDVQDGEYTYMGRPVVKKAWDELPARETGPLEHFGGDLQGITQALDYLAQLGVNGIYLTPIFESPSNHRYDTRDYLTIDRHLGGEPALRDLLDTAHARDIHVVLDGVFNHTGNEFAAFVSAFERSGEGSFYTFLESGRYESFFGVKTLPKVDYGVEEAFSELIESDAAPVRHWLRFGIDGWRLDVAHMMGSGGRDLGNLEVHRRLKRAAREVNPEAYIFGERFFDAEWALQGENEALGLVGGGEDGAMNYQGFALPFTDWLSGMRISEAPVSVSSEELAEVLFESWRVLPPPMRHCQYNLLGSHDVPRLLTRLRGDKDRLRAAFATLMAYPGVPGLYYGDEIGMTGGRDPLNRAPFPWDEAKWDHELLTYVRRLIQARRQTRALQRGSLVWLHAAGDDIAFARPYTAADGRLEVAILAATRRASGVSSLCISLSQLSLGTGTWRDAVTGEQFGARDGVLELELNPKVPARLLV